MPIFPKFTTGPDNPLNQPDKLFFPSSTSEGPAQTVLKTKANYFQASIGTVAGLPIAYKTPNVYLQTQRVYSPSRRMFPKGF